MAPSPTAERLGAIEPLGRGELLERCELGLAAKHGADDRAGQPSVHDLERVGAVLVEADEAGDASREVREAAGHERGIGAVGAHRCDQRPRPGHHGQPLAPDAIERVLAEACQQSQAFAQRGLEIKLATHGPLGDGGDLGLDAECVGHLVDALLLDDGRVHVGDQEALAPVLCRHHADVNFQARRSLTHQRPHAGGLGCSGGIEPNLDGLTLGQPHWHRKVDVRSRRPRTDASREAFQRVPLPLRRHQHKKIGRHRQFPCSTQGL